VGVFWQGSQQGLRMAGSEERINFLADISLLLADFRANPNIYLCV